MYHLVDYPSTNQKEIGLMVFSTYNTYKGQKGGEIFICTEQYQKNQSYFYVINIKSRKYTQENSMKYKKVDKIQDGQLAKLRRVGSE
jgi:hypothetical protein